MDVKFSQKQNQIHYIKLFPFRLFILNKTQYCVLPKQNTIIINVTPNETYNILPTFLCKTLFHKHLQDIKKPVCTSLSSLLFILLFIKSHILFLHILLVLHILFCTFLYSITHFTLYFSFFTYIYALVWCYFYIICILCTVH